MAWECQNTITLAAINALYVLAYKAMLHLDASAYSATRPIFHYLHIGDSNVTIFLI